MAIHGTKKRKHSFVREIDEDLEGLRDDCIAMFLNSGYTQQQIHAAGGPTPQTISKWLYKETMFPHHSTISSFARALGCKLVVVDRDKELPQRLTKKITIDGPAKMPPRKTRRYVKLERNSVKRAKGKK
jgi:hypothetical protein